MKSTTDMYECTHGPKKDCHACLVREMAAVLEQATQNFTPADWGWWLPRARAVLEKAKLIDDCVPAEEAAEAALDHGHPHE